MPNIKVSDSVYERLKTEAEGNFRTIGGQIEFLMANQRTHPVPARDKIEAENTPLPKKYEVGDLFQPEKNKSEATASGGVEPDCCKNENRPCKHWVWDSSTGEGYRNTLSGRFMEVE